MEQYARHILERVRFPHQLTALMTHLSVVVLETLGLVQAANESLVISHQTKSTIPLPFTRGKLI